MSLTDYSILVDHDPIIIDSDSDLDTLGFPGDGSIDKPYLIKNFRIIIDDYYSISISSTSKYITIRSCYTESINSGIKIDDTVSSNTILIEDNECRNSMYGIKIRTPASIIQNICINNTYGISIKNSPTSKVHNNECKDNEVMGITISDSANSEVKDNVCSNNQREDGIHIDDSPNSKVENNVCMNNGYNGIWIRFSHSSTISYNELTNNGLTIYENSKGYYLSYTFENNRVNDKILGYIESQKDTILEEPIYGQIFLIDCENVVVKNQEIYDASIGIKVLYSKSITIQKNICMENSWYAGIHIEHSIECKVIYNECWFNKMAGIRITSSENTTIENNLVVYNKIGISIDYSLFSSITDNQLLNNTLSGLSAYEIDYSIIWNNTCFRNNRGIAIAATADCEIDHYFFSSNTLHGLFLRYDTYNNTVHH
ncbi:MAG: right-handed parallel beta-helix repeat-containing protein, partial [Candidatus Heimdallarchaeota archaeon]|nr:right-handed parallel beta-helix repeat-containing protein [Candidatus Heimdallarchaeota archaeon]MCK4609915.1 right-handed parallel beta-helix repeat-containing protein [Candidatus Heimdallarchaeota archaeon]